MLSSLVWSNASDFGYSECGSNETTASRNERKLRFRASEKRNDKPKFVEALIKISRVDTLNISYDINPITLQSGGACNFIQNCLTWSQFPESVALGREGGQLPADRIHRKMQQLDNIMCFVAPLLRVGTRVVDFCCGCGHQSIPLAFLFPQCHFILVDMNQKSLEICKERCLRAGLSNITFVHGRIEEFQGPFDVGIALHACGAASDIMQQACIKQKAAYVSIPCCVGKIALSSYITGPRSNAFRAVLNRREYNCIVQAGDFGHGVDTCEGVCASSVTERCRTQRTEGGGFNPTPDVYNLIDNRRLAKCYLELDRNMWAEEQGYQTWMFECWPPGCTPKNDIIVGIHSSGQHSIDFFKQWISGGG